MLQGQRWSLGQEHPAQITLLPTLALAVPPLVSLTELLEEQSRARLALRRGLDGTSTLSPCPMLRVMGRLLKVGLATSNSPRSMGMGESQPRERQMAGDELFSCCQQGKNKELIEFLWSPACPLPEVDRGEPCPAQKIKAFSAILAGIVPPSLHTRSILDVCSWT